MTQTHWEFVSTYWNYTHAHSKTYSPSVSVFSKGKIMHTTEHQTSKLRFLLMIKIQLFVSFSFPHWVFDLAFLYIITIHFPPVCHAVVAVTTTYRLNTVKDILRWTNSTHYFLFQKQLQSVLIFSPLLWCRHWEVNSHGFKVWS